MTVRHIVMFTWRDDIPDDRPEQIRAALTELSGAMTGVESYRMGTDVGVNAGNYDFAVVADFASLDDYVRYRDDAEHQRIIAALIKPSISDRAAIQIELA